MCAFWCEKHCDKPCALLNCALCKGMEALPTNELKALKDWMSDKALTLAAAGAILDVAHTSVMKWLQGGGIRPKQRLALREHLLPYLGEGEASSVEILPATKPKPKVKAPEIALVSLPELSVTERHEVEDAAAGHGLLSQGWDCGCRIAELPKKSNLGLVRVVGDSMLPQLAPGREAVVISLDGCELEPEGSSSIEALRSAVPDGSIVLYILNGAGLALKRIRYVRGNFVPLIVELHADNGPWGEENGYPLRVKRTDHLILLGRVIGVVHV